MARLTLSLSTFLLLMLASFISACDRVEPPAVLDAEVELADGLSEASPGVETLPPADFPEADAGAVAVRRLTKVQLQNALKMLFGDALEVAPLSEPDLVLGGLASVGASSSTFSPRGVVSLEKLSVALVEQVLADEDMRAQLMVCTPESSSDDACFGDILSRLGRLAWRRSLEPEEVERLVDIALQSAQVLGSVDEGLAYALSALLQSPNFLYRFELGAFDEALDARLFTSVELASRLSFFLWNTPPDEELLDVAESGDLRDDVTLRKQAERLLLDPRARAGFSNFIHEYLHLKRLDKTTKDPLLFDRYFPSYSKDAREEVLRLYDYLVFDVNADIRKALTTRVTHLNPPLAALYGVPAPASDGFHRVLLPEDSNRVGILGQAAFLGAHSHPVSSSATLRGKAARTILLCQPIPEPPVDVDTSIPEPSGTTLTLRDRVAEHLENPACAGCHRLTDLIGLSMENYDSVGAWRDKDNGVLIDASGSLDGVEFDGPIGLAEALAAHPDYLSCFLQMLVRYATGREETNDEDPWLDILLGRMETQGNQVKSLMIDVVMSPLFRQAGELKEVSDD